MTSCHYDALVIGAGPAGSVASLVLARGGARVGLVDKARFPRDKACGDLIGPRGLQTLTDLGIGVTGPTVGDMEVVGPSGRGVVLRASPGRTYPGHAVVARRARFDADLYDAAVAAGAVPHNGRAGAPHFGDDGGLSGFDIDSGKGQPMRLTADVIIGADGATSRVGVAAGLVNEAQVLWAFAVRAYADAQPPLPRIHFWEPSPMAGYPGYGWVFPGEEGQANVGLGVGTRGDRRPGARASRDLPAFLASAGLDPSTVGRTMGGWLKMGMVGTNPASGRTLLVGDAAGLVNSLQGEGIAEAMGSARAAAEAVLAAGAGGAARIYRADLARRYAPFAATTAPVTTWMIDHPRAVSRIGRFLTAPLVGAAVSGGWGIYWNDLLEGARPGWAAAVARVAATAGRLVTSRSPVRHDVLEAVSPSAAP